jgi:two-component system, cell cycle sensor histidine kinase and response regulator CckA
LFVSQAYERVWGRPVETLYRNARAWLEAIHPDDRERVRTAMSRQAEGTYDEEYRVIRPDGGIRWIRDQAFPIRDESDQVYRIAGIAADITDRKAAQERLWQSQKLEAVGQLSGGIAHDFNNILTVIQGNASLLLDSLKGEDGEVVREIAEAAERGATLTRQLLLFSRNQPARLDAVDLDDIVRNMMKLMRRLVGERVTLETRLADGLPKVMADAGMLEQVILNLVVNARDAMPAGGIIHLATTRVEVGEERSVRYPDATPGVRVCLSVEDTGTGIPADVLPRIFEPFFTTKGADKGTGLGLATVYGIVKQHRGWIEVTSPPGSGTRFDTFLPAMEAAR